MITIQNPEVLSAAIPDVGGKEACFRCGHLLRSRAVNASADPANPLREAMPRAGAADPCVVVLFGASGDLTARKLVPGLYNLCREGLLPAAFATLGFARREKSDAQFRAEMLVAVNKHSRLKPVLPEVWRNFGGAIGYHTARFDDAAGYASLRARLEQLDRERGTQGNRLFYLATAPEYFPVILRHLGAAGLIADPRRGRPWTRVVIEKPFGHDLASARALNAAAAAVLDERQVFRIDHYLGKETVQNILALRFANAIFEPLWNRRYIDHVQITSVEDLGMEGRRGAYYDTAGAIRDVVQNHIMQLLSLVAMEPPVAMEADAIRDEKVKVLRALRPMTAEQVRENIVRAQYGPGSILGHAAKGYREEEAVAPASATETFVAMRLMLDTWRWAGVPFLIRTGKRLPKRVTEIAIQFKSAPTMLFGAGAQAAGGGPNLLALRIQPDEGISLAFEAKAPGMKLRLQPVKMDFRYGSSFGQPPPEAYERLLLDAMLGDSTLFTRADEAECAWRFVDSVVAGWQKSPPGGLPAYAAGTWGPPEADRLPEGVNAKWRRL
jgi:glucose-6-phosphate 1-dehydrogenase